MPAIEAGGCPVNAKQFNESYKPGEIFIYQPLRFLRGGPVVKTVDKAQDLMGVTMVEINREPFFINITALTPAR